MTMSTHVLDAVSGLPAAGVGVTLERTVDGRWTSLASASTDADGRVRDLGQLAAGVHRIRFDTGGYFGARGVATFYPEVIVVFEVTGAGQHQHVPLLLSPFAYSTYRGS